MGNEWVAIISALGASGIAGAIVSWWKDKSKNDATVTQIIREMSKEAVTDAREDLRAIRREMDELHEASREITGILREVLDLLEHEVVAAALLNHPATAAQLESLTVRARHLV